MSPEQTSAPGGTPAERLAAIVSADAVHVAPTRPPGGPRGGVPGTPTWIWSVLVDGEVFVRPYRGEASSWYASAVETGRGVVVSGEETIEVVLTPADETVLDAVDRAYSDTYAGSPYLPPMLEPGPRACTMRVSAVGDDA